MLATVELERYDRQIMIRGSGEEGQGRFKKAKVVIGFDLIIDAMGNLPGEDDNERQD